MIFSSNFEDEYQMFLDGKLGDYDGGFNSLEQYQSYLFSISSVHYFDILSLNLNVPFDLLSTSLVHHSDVDLLDLNTPFDCFCVINSIYRDSSNYKGSSFCYQAELKINKIIECIEDMR